MGKKSLPIHLYLELSHRILQHESIILTTHVGPDPDGIGSIVSLGRALQQLGKTVHIIIEEPLWYKYKYLDPEGSIFSLDDFLGKKTAVNFEESLLIVVDTHKLSRTGFKISSFLSPFKNIIFIDHHPNPVPTAMTASGVDHQHFIDEKAAATGEMIATLINTLGVTFDDVMALGLYTAILVDTNVFRYPSVTGNTHRLIAEFLDHGIPSHTAYNLINGAKKLTSMHLLGQILKNAQVGPLGLVAWIWIQESDLRDYNSELEDTHAYINNLLALEGVRIACMFRQDGPRLKLSMRSHGDIDVGEIAAQFGGGGHSHSAATVIEIPPNDSRENFIHDLILKLERQL
ncbi:MAG: bifunctional oligoribonuclease/PAP phosphatase NrnA [Bacteriovoracaceae bacterium]|nr:bifunctional oligoribonuclease/PAP phosphatase NrnA [Bacteriovoracaceae bacterium]